MNKHIDCFGTDIHDYICRVYDLNDWDKDKTFGNIKAWLDMQKYLKEISDMDYYNMTQYVVDVIADL